MTEEFLHCVWRFKLYTPKLKLIDGESVSVLNTGEYHQNSGPDFFNARVRIGNTVWAGNVEIHVNSSDWFRHHHHLDRAYDNLILHVVYRHDKEILDSNLKPLPTLELRDQLIDQAWNKYQSMMASKLWIPCERMISQMETVHMNSWVDRLMVERLERKSEQVKMALAASGNDWNTAFYRLTAVNMGFKLNKEPFERLAASISYPNLLRHSDNLFQIEAMLFGQAGMLAGEFEDEYPKALKKEYSFLSKKFSLSSMDAKTWKFLRLHPGNFPTLRIAQFASFIHHSQGMIYKMISGDINMETLFSGIEVSDYWKTHYRFDKQTGKAGGKLGTEASHLLCINLVVPYLFTLGKETGRPQIADKALMILFELKGETNSVIRKWAEMGMETSTAMQTQALLELKARYCERKKCLSCGIGIRLLK
ncbi:MAG: DUF2851 family protein [Bacteroidales bacterium]|nr:DUF2851 family protein [Bacteroidales bacterium]